MLCCVSLVQKHRINQKALQRNGHVILEVVSLMEGRGQLKSIFIRDFKRNGQGMKMGGKKALVFAWLLRKGVNNSKKKYILCCSLQRYLLNEFSF